MIDISIIIPAYNEEQRIVKNLKSALDYLQKQNLKFEIIVVDDGSDDNTVKVINNFNDSIKVIQLGKNLGKGAAVRTGMLSAKGKITLFSDADFSTPLYEMQKLIKKIDDGADICIGSRALDRSYVKKHQPFYREFMGKIFNQFVQFLVFKGITDTQCGFKAFKKEIANKLFSLSKINGFSFDVEILYLATKFGYKIEQVPVEWYNDTRSKVNPIKDSLSMFLELIKIRKLHRKLFK